MGAVLAVVVATVIVLVTADRSVTGTARGDGRSPWPVGGPLGAAMSDRPHELWRVGGGAAFPAVGVSDVAYADSSRTQVVVTAVGDDRALRVQILDPRTGIARWPQTAAVPDGRRCVLSLWGAAMCLAQSASGSASVTVLSAGTGATIATVPLPGTGPATVRTARDGVIVGRGDPSGLILSAVGADGRLRWTSGPTPRALDYTVAQTPGLVATRSVSGPDRVYRLSDGATVGDTTTELGRDPGRTVSRIGVNAHGFTVSTVTGDDYRMTFHRPDGAITGTSTAAFVDGSTLSPAQLGSPDCDRVPLLRPGSRGRPGAVAVADAGSGALSWQRDIGASAPTTACLGGRLLLRPGGAADDQVFDLRAGTPVGSVPTGGAPLIGADATTLAVDPPAVRTRGKPVTDDGIAVYDVATGARLWSATGVWSVGPDALYTQSQATRTLSREVVD
ncbi:hypothetical protein [Williamsia sterculiae]|uniref:hypothetical protein n=1 Tax=Williamsia sterculiae TaxID=1344003 RepID=UPI001180C15D|nr:hypothetical protein [Williamsia sterculiae]